MSTTPRPPTREPLVDRIQPELVLAVGAGVALLIEAAAAALGGPGSAPAAAILATMVAAFTIAAVLRRRGRHRIGALLVGGTILAAIPAFLAFYPANYGISLLAPVAFVFAVPHLRGASLAVFALATALVTLTGNGLGVGPGFPAGSGLDELATRYGAIAVTMVLLTMIWRMHRRARASDIRFRRLVDDLPMGVARTGADGRLMEVNTAFARILGYPAPASLLGSNSPAPFETAGAGDALGRTSALDGTHEGEVELRRADGSNVWVWYRTRSDRAADATVRWFDTVIDDVTSDRAERESRNLLAAIADSAVDAVFAQGTDGTVLTWNAGAERMYGWVREEMVGQNIQRVIGEQDRATQEDVLRRVAAGESVGPLDVRRVARDGRELVVSLIVAPARDADGRVVAAATIARDVTDEHALRAQRTLLEEQLRHAQKMEAVGRLAGGIAHDFNNLLTAIQGYGQLVADELSGRELEDQRQVLAAAEQAAVLVRQLLQFSREAPVDRHPVDVDGVVRSALELMHRIVPESVQLETRMASEQHVLADVVELQQALLSLVTNAIEAMPAGGTLTVATDPTTLAAPGLGLPAGEYVRIGVSDTGVGMDTRTRERAFDPFYTTKGEADRSGLGLSTVYGLAQRSGGRVDVESAPGAGTSVSMLLPVIGPTPSPAR